MSSQNSNSKGVSNTQLIVGFIVIMILLFFSVTSVKGQTSGERIITPADDVAGSGVVVGIAVSKLDADTITPADTTEKPNFFGRMRDSMQMKNFWVLGRIGVGSIVAPEVHGFLDSWYFGAAYSFQNPFLEEDPSLGQSRFVAIGYNFKPYGQNPIVGGLRVDFTQPSDEATMFFLDYHKFSVKTKNDKKKNKYLYLSAAGNQNLAMLNWGFGRRLNTRLNVGYNWAEKNPLLGMTVAYQFALWQPQALRPLTRKERRQ